MSMSHLIGKKIETEYGQCYSSYEAFMKQGFIKQEWRDAWRSGRSVESGQIAEVLAVSEHTNYNALVAVIRTKDGNVFLHSVNENTIAFDETPKPEYTTYVNEAKRTVVVILKDGRKGIAKCSADDHFDPVVGFAVAYTKAVTGKNYETLKSELPKSKTPLLKLVISGGEPRGTLGTKTPFTDSLGTRLYVGDVVNDGSDLDPECVMAADERTGLAFLMGWKGTTVGKQGDLSPLIGNTVLKVKDYRSHRIGDGFCSNLVKVFADK